MFIKKSRTWRSDPHADRKKALEKQKELASKLLERKAKPPVAPVPTAKVTTEVVSDPRALKPFGDVAFGNAQVPLYDRSIPDAALGVQPWTNALTNVVLDAINTGTCHLCLLWPGRFSGIPLLHVLATLECIAAGHYEGIRTALFPAKQNAAYPLNHLLIDRKRLAKLRGPVVQHFAAADKQTKSAGKHTGSTGNTFWPALANIESHYPNAEMPTLAEVVPSFIYDAETKLWGTYRRLLERSLGKIRLAVRRHFASVREVDAKNAPNALLVIPAGTNKEQWKAALAPAENGPPLNLLLFDATGAQSRDNSRAIGRIPEFLQLGKGPLGALAGAVVVTDEPVLYFTLKARLKEAAVAVTTHVLIAESDAQESALSPDAKPDGWVPAARTNANCHVNIMDREAAEIAMALHRVGQELSPGAGREHCEAACYYLLRTATMPAGYRDLGTWLQEDEQGEYLRKRYDWNEYQHRLQTVIDSGAAREHTERLRKAMTKAISLIDAYAEGTPIALRLAREIENLLKKSNRQLLLVLPSLNDIELAQHFLRRRLADNPAALEFANQHIMFRTHAEVGATWSALRKNDEVVFVGLNSEALRIILSDEHLPHGTTLLLSFRQAESHLQALKALKTLGELKPYRGRMGLLETEIERRLQEFKGALNLNTLPLHAYSGPT